MHFVGHNKYKRIIRNGVLLFQKKGRLIAICKNEKFKEI